MKCHQPGCTGTIADGYCDVCGMPPAAGTGSAAGSAARSAAAPAAGGVADGAACTQPGCSGHIQDGYCDVCGSPAGLDRLDHQGEADPVSTAISSSTSASKVQSAAIGSKRAGGTTATRRSRTGSQRMRAARLGAGLTVVPPAAAVDAAKAIVAHPEVPGGEADLLQVRQSGGPGARRPARPDGGLLPQVRPGVLVRTEAPAR